MGHPAWCPIKSAYSSTSPRRTSVAVRQVFRFRWLVEDCTPLTPEHKGHLDVVAAQDAMYALRIHLHYASVPTGTGQSPPKVSGDSSILTRQRAPRYSHT